MPIYLIYAVIGLVLLILEIVVPGFVLLPIGVAFLLTAGLSFFVASVTIQLIFLAVLAPVCVVGLRKIFVKHATAKHVTNFEGLVGKEGHVEEDIPAHSRGYVKVYGDSWKVEGLKHEALGKGTKVIVDHVEGTKIFVRKA